jgi:hypothetical protein
MSVPRRPGRDAGMVTAELAVGLPVLLLFVLVAIGAVDATVQKVRCVDAARDSALAAARGQSGQAAGHAVAPAGARITLSGDDRTVTATVAVLVHPLGLHVPGLAVSASAVAAREPGEPR